MLNVRIMSSTARRRLCCSQRKSGGTVPRRHRRSPRAVPCGSMRGRLSVMPPPVMCAIPLMRPPRAAAAPPADTSDAVRAAPRRRSRRARHVAVDAAAPALEHNPPRERVAVGVQARRRHADERRRRSRSARPLISRVAIDDADDEARRGRTRRRRRTRASPRSRRRAARSCSRGTPRAIAADDRFGNLRRQPAGGEVVEKEQRPAPCTRMSLTQWLTRSTPTVSWRPVMNATFSLVPTPSALETSTGCGISRCRLETARRTSRCPTGRSCVKVERASDGSAGRFRCRRRCQPLSLVVHQPMTGSRSKSAIEIGWDSTLTGSGFSFSASCRYAASSRGNATGYTPV